MLMKHSPGQCLSFSKMSPLAWHFWVKYLSCSSRIWCSWPNFNQKYNFYQYRFNTVASFSLRVKKRKSNYDLISHNDSWFWLILQYIYIWQCGFLSHNFSFFIIETQILVSINLFLIISTVSCNFNFIFHIAALYCDKSLYISKLPIFF